MFVARKLSVELDAWSIFSETLIVNEIGVEGLSLLLERTADGEENWDFGLAPDTDQQGWLSSLPVVIDRVSMPGARLRFIGPRLERPLDIHFTTLEQKRAPDDMLELTVLGQANEAELALTGRAGPFASLLAAKDFQFEFNGQVGELTLAANIRVDDLARPVNTTATVRLQGADASYLTSALGVRNLGKGPIDLTATLSPAADRQGISGSVAGKFGEFEVEADTELSEPSHIGKLTLNARIAGPDLSFLGGLAGINQLPPEPFRLSAKIHRAEQAVDIEDAELNLPDSELQVQGSINRLDKLAESSLRLHVRGDDIDRFRKLLRLPGVATGPFELTVALDPAPAGQAAGRELVDLKMTNSAGVMSAKGQLGPYPDYYGTRLAFSASGPDFTPLARAAGISNLPGGPFNSSGTVEWTPAGLGLRGSALKIGSDRLTLDGVIGRRPRTDSSNLRFGLEGSSLAAIASRLGVANLPARPYKISGGLRRQQGRNRIDGVVIAAAGARLQLAGQLGQPPAWQNTDLTFTFDGANLAPFAALAGGYKLPAGAFRATGGMALGKDQVRLTAVNFAVTGAAGQVTTAIGLPVGKVATTFDVQVKGTDLGAVLPEVRGKTAVPAPFELRGSGTWRTGQWSFKGFDVNAAGTVVTLDGGLDQAPDYSATALRAQVKSQDLARAGRLFGLTLPAQPLDLTATFSGTARTLRADSVTATLGDSDFAGNLAFSREGKPDLTVAFQSELLDLTPYTGAAPAPAGPAPGPRTRKDARLIPDWKLPLELLDKANVRASVRSRKTRLFGKTYDDLSLQATLTNGQLTVDPIAFNGLGGKLTGRFEITPGSGPPMVRLTGSGQDLLLSIIPGATGTADAARYQVQIDLTGTGSGTRDLAASASGKMRFIGAGGRIANSRLTGLAAGFITQLISTLNPFTKRQPYTEMVCQALLFRTDGGVLRTDPAIVVRMKELDIISQGSIDLRTEKIDFTFKTSARSGLGISAAQFVNPYVKVSGTLAAPGLTVDPTGALVTGGAAFATGGLSILATTVWDRVSRQKDPCAAAVAEADKKR